MTSRLETHNVDIKSIKFDGINHKDAPDYCDAFIVYASFTDGSELTDSELDELNEDSQFVYETLQDYLY